MSQNDDDEDENGTAGPRGKPNAWFVDHAPDTFGGGYRGVKPAPHGGHATVKAEDTTGSIDLCWCGLPFDHDWPGKVLGAKHPRKELTVGTTETVKRIERRALRAYHPDLVDVITTAVNDYDVKYRQTAHSVILFPPDGAAPYTIHARNTDNQAKGAQKWFVRHCVPKGVPIKGTKTVARKTVDEVVIKELAETMNSEEHLPKLDEPTAEPSQPAVEPPTPEPTADAPEEWVPYIVHKGRSNERVHDFILTTDGKKVKCPKDGWIGKNTAIGGHIRIHHTDTSTLWGPEARQKSVESTRVFKLTQKVEQAIEGLQAAIGVTPQTVDVEAITAERDQLKAKVSELETKISDMETKQALAREALGL